MTAKTKTSIAAAIATTDINQAIALASREITRRQAATQEDAVREIQCTMVRLQRALESAAKGERIRLSDVQDVASVAVLVAQVGAFDSALESINGNLKMVNA